MLIYSLEGSKEEQMLLLPGAHWAYIDHKREEWGASQEPRGPFSEVLPWTHNLPRMQELAMAQPEMNQKKRVRPTRDFILLLTFGLSFSDSPFNCRF